MATKTEGSTPRSGSGEIGFSGELADGTKIDIHGNQQGGSSKDSNKMNTSANRQGGRASQGSSTGSQRASGNNAARQAKGNGSPYATSDNFAPARAGGGTQNIDNNALSEGLSNQGPIMGGQNDISAGGAPLTQPGAAGGQLSDLDAHTPTARELADAEAATAGIGDLRSNKNLKEDDPWLAKQNRQDLKEKARSDKEASAIPSLDMRKAENASFYNSSAKTTGLKGKALQYIKKKKWKFIAGGIGIGGAVFLFLLIFFLLGTLLIPHFVSNVVGWQFVRVTRAAYVSSSDVMDEQIATASAKQRALDAMEAKYGKVQDFNDLKDLNGEEINKVGKNLGTSEQFTENVAKVDGEQRVTSLSYLDQQTGKTIKIALGEGGQFETYIGFPPAISGDAAAKLAVNDSINAWNLNKDPFEGSPSTYASPEVTDDIIGTQLGYNTGGEPPSDTSDSKSAEANEGAVETDSEAAIDDNTAVGTSNVDQINSAEQTADSELQADLKDPAKVATIVNESGNIPDDVVQTVNNTFVQSALDSVASKVGNLLNPLTGELIPVCIVDGGSKTSGPTAQAQSREVQRSAVLTMAVADQQKRGSPYVNAAMVGAWNWKINGDQRDGGVSDSIPIQRASGQKVSTTSQIPTEGSPLGGLANSGNILAALNIPFAGQLQSALDTICPAITNIWVNLGLGVGNITLLILAAIFTGGTGDAVEAGATAATDEAATVATDSIVSRVLASFATKSGASGFDIAKDFGKNLVVKGVVQGGLTAMATFLAKFIVLSQSGILHGGLATGPQFDNSVDQGTNQLTNEIVGHAYGGRPLTNSEAMAVQQDDNKTLSAFNQSQSAYKRYLALSNPQSLASVLSDRVAINLNYGFFGSVLGDISNIFNPARLMPQVLFGGISGEANAASSQDTQDYGDVQQGYSDEEYAMIAKNTTYKSPSENELVLDNSGDKDQIAQTYGACFDDSVATLVSTTDSSGTPYIVRDAQGDVSQTEGLCSPQNLGPDNPTYGDLVFRYRLALGYNTTISILKSTANAT